jgi:hypothetical protein
MEINTKFNVGNHVTGISYKHQIVDFEIAKISVSAKADSVEVDYYPSDGKGGYEFTSFPEKYCFATKDEALAYIQGK